jgi:hypothetical protein
MYFPCCGRVVSKPEVGIVKRRDWKGRDKRYSREIIPIGRHSSRPVQFSVPGRGKKDIMLEQFGPRTLAGWPIAPAKLNG